MDDLMAFAATTLKVDGRLVYLLPITPGYAESDLPAHPWYWD
jgi:hypothetical protein